MRKGMLELNAIHRTILSNDLGAIAAFLFDIGCGRYPLPQQDSPASLERWCNDLEAVRADHTEVQGWLRDLGFALGYGVWIAANDVGRAYGNGRLGDGCLERLPDSIMQDSNRETIRLIDVLWIDQDDLAVAAAFEVEHTTSIYSGIVRMLDLALGVQGASAGNFFLVAPDDREADVRAQFARPALSRVGELDLRYLSYSDLGRHREAIGRFGSGLKGMLAIAKPIRPTVLGLGRA